ncbi:MAG: dockerin type I domain-containing protein, partial [bacterium]
YAGGLLGTLLKTIPTELIALSSINLDLTLFIQGFYDAGTNSMQPDTVIVYLRNTSSPYNKIDSAVSVLSSSGQGTFSFQNASNGENYYIQVSHRNSIETWSAAGNIFTSSQLTYNFSTSASRAFGNNMIQVDASPIRFAIYNGDVNQDGIVEVTDMSMIDNDALNLVSGYLSTDVNGDNFVDITDLAIADNNVFYIVSRIIP